VPGGQSGDLSPALSALWTAAAEQARLHEAALASADRLERAPVLLLDQDAVVLLILRAPYLQHRHRFIAQLDLQIMATNCVSSRNIAEDLRLMLR